MHRFVVSVVIGSEALSRNLGHPSQFVIQSGADSVTAQVSGAQAPRARAELPQIR